MVNELELIALATEFDLYMSFVKRLIINMPNSADRVRGAMWLNKLRSVRDDNFKKLRNEHLKLLLFALHRRALVGIFAKPPPDELESFHDGLTLTEMTKELIEITEKQAMHAENEGDGPKQCPLPPVSTAISHDLMEYAAVQEIPKFGAHVFYAVSNQPIQYWTKPPKNLFPAMGDIPNNLQWEHLFAKITDHVLEKEAEIDAAMARAKAEEAGELEPETPDFSKKMDVKVCPPIPIFKWKPDSALKIHQNYDFSDVGVAEDVEQQGAHQLELDEITFSILDHSLPGRQRVAIRKPYFDDLPADIEERRYHGVVQEIPEFEPKMSFCNIISEGSEDYRSIYFKDDNEDVCDPCSPNFDPCSPSCQEPDPCDPCNPLFDPCDPICRSPDSNQCNPCDPCFDPSDPCCQSMKSDPCSMTSSSCFDLCDQPSVQKGNQRRNSKICITVEDRRNRQGSRGSQRSTPRSSSRSCVGDRRSSISSTKCNNKEEQWNQDQFDARPYKHSENCSCNESFANNEIYNSVPSLPADFKFTASLSVSSGFSQEHSCSNNNMADNNLCQ